MSGGGAEATDGDGACGAGESPASVEARAVEAFRRRFGAAPRVIASAPGRVNLIGEHVDYADGVVLPLAIAERAAVALGAGDAGAAPSSGGPGATAIRGQARAQHPSAESFSDIESIELGRVARVRSPANFEALPPRHADAWTNAVMGPLRELFDHGVGLPPIRAVIASDVPIGAGLSSSAALAVAMAAGALRLVRAGRPRAGDERPRLVGADHGPVCIEGAELARLLQRAERRFVGTPCGIMDMMTAIAAGSGGALRLDCRSLDLERISLPSSITLFLVDSGERHALASSDYGTRRAEVEEAAARMGLSSLRDCSAEQLARAKLPGVLRRRATHVVREIERVDRAVEALRRGDAELFGHLVSQSHASLRDDFDVSVPKVDRIVAAAEGADEGVLGARMIGGGFGGSVLVVAQSERARMVEESMRRCGLASPPHALRMVRGGTGYTSTVLEDST